MFNFDLCSGEIANSRYENREFLICASSAGAEHSASSLATWLTRRLTG
jgi:hypothetical protein